MRWLAGVMAMTLSAMASADCAPPEPWKTTARKVVLVGTFTDVLGHRATFAIDAATGVTLGPLDHRSEAPGKPGATGVLESKHRGARADGELLSFKPQAFEVEVTAKLDAYAAALAQAEVGTAAVTSDVEAQGVLFGASSAVAENRLAGYQVTSLRGVDGALLTRVVRQPLKAIAAFKAGKPDNWIALLPKAASLWLENPKTFKTRLVDALDGESVWFGYALDEEAKNPFECESDEGPFLRAGRLSEAVVAEVLKRKEPAFAEAFFAALRGVSATTKAWLVEVSATHWLLLEKGGGLTVLEHSARAPVLSAVQYVGRAGKAAAKPWRLLRGEALSQTKKAERVKVGAEDAAAVVKELKANIRSGGHSATVGPSLALLDALHADGAVDAEVWEHLLTLPGNKPGSLAEGANAWSPYLEGAIRSSRRAELVKALLERLPALFAAWSGAKREADADVLRKFMFNVLGPGVLLCLSKGEVACARQAVDAMSMPSFAPLLPAGTKLSPETDYKYSESRVLLYQDLLAAQSGQPRSEKSNPSFQADLFRAFTRNEDPADVKKWAQQLAKQGYPLR